MSPQQRNAAFLIGFVLFILLLAAWFTFAAEDDTTVAYGILIPSLSATAAAGQPLFDENCASCHGPFGTGTDSGPPLIHKIYEPSHHSDVSFVRAMDQGTVAHHWEFGDMPAQPQVAAADHGKIIAYIREIQRANGIN